MFDVSGNDIASLGDADLRSLVVQLAIAEIRSKGCPVSSVTAGGNQDAADGGLDVRVDCPREIAEPDFVPRRLTGFQVKKPDMRAGAIEKEMRPEGVLRDVIREIADAAGAYVIVSGQGSVAAKPLTDRRRAMRAALRDLPNAAHLQTDFYDRDRLANWANEYPGIAAWVRARVGRPLSGWSRIDDWEGDGVGNPKPYLFDDKACLADESSRDGKYLTIAEGIVKVRTALREPTQCIRLVGLSGVGKTRFVRALFEQGVGEDPLDSSLAIYTDYSTETDPTARDMARDLLARGQSAILIVDNCNPATHSELARLCSASASKVSLITVEYDVRDDEPEHTDVFRLRSASPELITAWITQSFPDISQIDRDKIAEFSDGNFRVARALAETLGKGETLGSLKSRDLFERIFRQRNEPDQQLLQAAEDLSLLYSVDGDSVSDESELGLVGSIRGIGAPPLYASLAEMRHRGVVQARGRFRAILPQAIANRLAAYALDRIPPSVFDKFCGTLTPRMLRSVSRRLGYLHESADARAAVARWLRVDGPVGDLMESGGEGFQIIANIAPVAPEAVLAKFEERGLELTGQQWVGLIKSIGYDASLFDRAATLLARFAGSEPESNNVNSARNAFSGMFHFSLSGTQATPEQRRSLIKQLAASSEENLRNSAQIALRALLESNSYTFSVSRDFGARSRDWGWQPKINQDVWDWFEEAIALTIELLPEADARALVAKSARSLWHYPTCRDALERAATTFTAKRPWVEGWIAFRAALHSDGKKMSDEVRARLEKLVERLKPSDLLNRARAIVLNRTRGGWEISDDEEGDGDANNAWERAGQMAQKIGYSLAEAAAVRAEFLAELLVEPHALRAFECGRGLAEGANDLWAQWRELVSAYSAAEPKMRDPASLSGFLYEAHQRNKSFASLALEDSIDNPDLASALPFLQARVGIDAEGIARLRRAIRKGVVVAGNFLRIANSVVSKSPPEPLASLLKDIAKLSGGVDIAVEILHAHFYGSREEPVEQNARLVLVGRDLLTRVDFGKDTPLRDFGANKVIKICLAGEAGQRGAKKVCANLRSAFESYKVFSHNVSYILKALFETQPLVALDTFFVPAPLDPQLFDWHSHMGSPLDYVDPTILQEWASRDSSVRYPLLGRLFSTFGRTNGEDEKEFSPLFLSMLAHAPDKQLFLGDLWGRLHPRGWSGSLAAILIRRKKQVMKLAEHSDEQVRAWVADKMPELDRWIEQERGRDRASEETFE